MSILRIYGYHANSVKPSLILTGKRLPADQAYPVHIRMAIERRSAFDL